MPRHRTNHGYLAAFVAFLLCVGAAALPLLRHQAQATNPLAAITVVPGVTPPAELAPVALLNVAKPFQADARRAQLPAVRSAQALLVRAEDSRIHALAHAALRIGRAIMLPFRDSRPTLVLPPRAQPYGVADLTAAGALIPMRERAGLLLVTNVLLAPGANLVLNGDPGGALRALYLACGRGGISSIVGWEASMRLSGRDAGAPLAITGWDVEAGKPAADTDSGRPYIRAVGSQLMLQYVRVSSLGFWSGRTGGVAWTGTNSRRSTGGATDSTFVGNTYGAFTSRTSHAVFNNDLFELNEVDGLRLHRDTVASSVAHSAAARNGASGFVIDRGSSADVMDSDVAVNNGANGYLLDGRALVHGASPSGAEPQVSTGVILRNSSAQLNGQRGIMVEGGAGLRLAFNAVCASRIAITLRDGGANTVLSGNHVTCAGRIALSIEPGVTGTTIVGNSFSNSRIGVLVSGALGVHLFRNRFSDNTVFSVAIRGTARGVVLDGNAFVGRGLRTVDVRAGTAQPLVLNSDATGWNHRTRRTAVTYLLYHPLLLIWLTIMSLVIAATCIARVRRTPTRLYAHNFAGRAPTLSQASAAAPPTPTSMTTVLPVRAAGER